MKISEDKSNPPLLNPENGRYKGQEKVNAEIFTAIEILGRKLERTEAERDRLADRLEMLESAATLDEETGKIYLPAVIGSDVRSGKSSTRNYFMIATSMVSSVFAIAAFTLVLLQNPSFSFEKIAQLTKLYDASQLIGREKNATLSADEKAVPAPAETAVNEQAPEEAELAEVKDANTDEVVKTEQASEVAAVPVAVAPDVPTADEDLEQDVNMEQAMTAPAPAAEPVAPPAVPKLTPPALTDNNSKAVKPEDTAAVVAAVEETNAVEQIKPEERKGGVDYDLPSDGNLKDTLKQLEQAAYSGVPEAQHDLGVYYAEGQLVNKDYRRAVYWLKKAAFNGVPNAAYNLAVMYQQGLGVDKDLKEAINFYGYAIDLGHAEALYNLGIMYFEGQGTNRNIPKGVAYFKRAAQKGVVEAAYNLGVLYESKVMGKQDLNEAIKWYRQASRAGYAKADEALRKLDAASALSKVEQSDVLRR